MRLGIDTAVLVFVIGPRNGPLPPERVLNYVA